MVIGRIHFSSRNYVWFDYQLNGEKFFAVFSRFLPGCYPVVDGKIVREERFKSMSPHAFIKMRHGSEKSIKSIIHVLGFSLVDWEALGKSFFCHDHINLCNNLLSLLCRVRCPSPIRWTCEAAHDSSTDIRADRYRRPPVSSCSAGCCHVGLRQPDRRAQRRGRRES